MPDYRIAFWNLENLFAPAGFADREPWIAKEMEGELKGWTQALFDRKVSQLASVIATMGAGTGPDVLGVCEAENRYVLEQLAAAASAALPGRSYKLVHADSTRDQRGIDTAFVYDSALFRVDRKAVFSHFVMRRTGTRDITQATFTSRGGNDLVALANHWPSRSGGVLESAGFRAVAGETLAYWHERIREERGEDIAIVAMGDLNDEPWDASVLFNANTSRERGDIERSRSARLFNLAWGYLRTPAVDHRGGARLLDGTFYFDGGGNLLDQILVNRSLLSGRGGLRVLEETAGLEAAPIMLDHRVSAGPIPYGLPRGDAAKNVDRDGFSDHFPVGVTIRE